jgi:hypothetical protein
VHVPWTILGITRFGYSRREAISDDAAACFQLSARSPHAPPMISLFASKGAWASVAYPQGTRGRRPSPYAIQIAFGLVARRFTDALLSNLNTPISLLIRFAAHGNIDEAA